MKTIRYELTRMTLQTKKEADEALAKLPAGGGHITLDVVDDNGEVGHTCIFRGADGNFWVRKGCPNPKDLYRKVRADRKLDKVMVAVNERDYMRPWET